LTLIHVQVGKQLLSPSLLFTHCFFNSENYTIRIVNKGHTLYQSRRARYVALRGCLGRDRVIDVFTPTNTTHTASNCASLFHRSSCPSKRHSWLVLWCLTPLPTIFNYIVSVSFIDGGNQSARRKSTDLPQVTDKLT
jgi:hypothetical protein